MRARLTTRQTRTLPAADPVPAPRRRARGNLVALPFPLVALRSLRPAPRTSSSPSASRPPASSSASSSSTTSSSPTPPARASASAVSSEARHSRYGEGPPRSRSWLWVLQRPAAPPTTAAKVPTAQEFSSGWAEMNHPRNTKPASVISALMLAVRRGSPKLRHH
jgi:hypothetical protein